MKKKFGGGVRGHYDTFYFIHKMILFSSKLTISLKEMHDEDIEDEIRDAFRVFDREGHGYISVVDLKDVLTHLGEKLSLEECEVSTEQPEGPVLYEWNIQELLEEADIDRDGNIFYDEFIAMIFKVEYWCRSVTPGQVNVLF